MQGICYKVLKQEMQRKKQDNCVNLWLSLIKLKIEAYKENAEDDKMVVYGVK